MTPRGIFSHSRRLLLLRRIFASRLGARGYANLAAFSVRRFLLGKEVPVSVMIALTYRCQCDCVHCAVSSLSRSGAGELKTAQVASLMRQARGLGAIKVGFTGGEPLLRRDLPELVRRAYDEGLSNSIDTNGALLDSRLARELKRAGLSNMNVSLDHPEARRHDRLRRLPGCHAAALRAVAHCADAGLPCVVSTYLTDRAMEGGAIEELVALARSSGAAGVRVLFPIYSGKFHGRRKPLLSPENQRKFFAEIADGSFVYSESPFFDFLTSRLECSMLKRLSVYVTPYGEVKSCYVSPRALGSVLERPLADILARRCPSADRAAALDCQSC